jgi:DNA-binding MarR family transcriptional regulator
LKKGSLKTVSSPCTCINLRRAASVVTKYYDRKLAPSQLTVVQYSLLQHIRLFGPISVSDLALKVRLDRTTLVRNIKPLELDGLIVDNSKSGTRNRQLQLTVEGIIKVKSAELLWKEAQAFIEQHLGQENLQKLTTLLTEVEKVEV